MKTYKDIVKDIYEAIGIYATDEALEIGKNILVKELKQKSPVKQFMFIEDGSVDLSELDDLERRNPGIKIVVYKQGSAWPVIKNTL